MKQERKFNYKEPAEYFPKELRKKYKIGEYAEDDKAPAKKTVKKTKKK